MSGPQLTYATSMGLGLDGARRQCIDWGGGGAAGGCQCLVLNAERSAANREPRGRATRRWLQSPQGEQQTCAIHRNPSDLFKHVQRQLSVDLFEPLSWTVVNCTLLLWACGITSWVVASYDLDPLPSCA